MLDWPDDRATRGAAIEMREPQVVAEEIRDARLEAIELRERVFAHGEKEADTESRPLHRLGKLDEERAGLVLAFVVEEVLLDAVEDHVDIVRESRRARLERVRERHTRFDVGRRCNSGREPSRRVVLPRIENDYTERIPLGTQCARHAGPEHGALPHARVAVENGQLRGHEICADDLPLAVPPEEQAGVRVGVVERRQALVRTTDLRHARAASVTR